MRGRFSHPIVAGLVAILLAASGAPAWADLGLPPEGRDLVELTDGRVLTCRVGAEQGGEVELAFPSGTVRVAGKRIARTRLWRDFDPAPRDDAEKAKVAQGLVRWDGQWLPAEKAAALRKAEVDAAEAIRKDDEAHSLWENRRKVETEHFVVEANISKANLDYYLELLENYYEQLMKHLQVKQTAREKKKKMPMYFYRYREEYWKRYKEETGGKGENTLGYFVPMMGREHLCLFDQRWGREETLQTLLHEATHAILFLAEPQVRIPRWVNEGCAEYFSGATYEKGKFTFGQPQDDRLLGFHLMIARNKVFPMDDLMRTGNPDQDALGKFEGRHYAQAWTLIHFLMHANDGAYAPKFRAYLQKHLSRQGVSFLAIPATSMKYVKPEDDRALLLRLLGMKDWDKLQKDLADYAKTLPMRSARAYVSRGEVRYWVDKDVEGANEDFASALRNMGDDALVLYDLAVAYSQIPDRGEEALPLLKRAVEMDPLHVGIRYEYAQQLSSDEAMPQYRLCTEIEPERGAPAGELAWLLYRDELGETLKVPEDKVAVAKEALDLALRAAKHEPDHRHFHTLGGLHVALGRFAEARAAEERAVQEDPENLSYVMRLALVQALVGEADGFAKTLGRAQLLIRRDSSNESSRTAMQFAFRQTAQTCVDWDKKAEGVAALKAWTARRPPQTEEEWVLYARLLRKLDDEAGAVEAAKQGKAAFPSSKDLENIVEAGD